MEVLEFWKRGIFLKQLDLAPHNAYTMHIYVIYGSCAASFIVLTLNTVEEVRDTNFL